MKTNLLMLSVAILTLSVLQSCTKNSEVISKSNESQIATSEQSGDMLITDTSMLCYYPFNGTLKDKSGHGNNGVLSGTISYVTDRFGNAFKAVSFAASGAWIEIPEADFIGLRSVTISMDFFPTTDAFQELISKMSYSIPVGYPGFYQSFTTALKPGGIVGFDIRQENSCQALVGTGWNPNIDASTSVTLNQWNHIAITFNDVEQKIYLNGNLVATGTKTASPICAGEPIRLGVWWQSDPVYFTGYMDEVRIFKRVLSAREIKKLSAL